jgi:hypothetical protein
MEAWALGFGPIARWGIEGASGLGRHTAMYLAERGHDVRDCSPNRTNERRRARNQGKTDASDSLRIARETQADPAMPRAFKRAEGDAGPDETAELLALWHKARRSLLKSRQHILNEAENLLCDLPLETRELHDLGVANFLRARQRGSRQLRPRRSEEAGGINPERAGSWPGTCASRSATTWCSPR